MGNRCEHAAPHGAFPCAGDDAWVAIAIWTDEEWRAFAGISGVDDAAWTQLEGRLADQDRLEQHIGAWTRQHPALELAARLQAHGLEAVPVQSFPEVFDDPQLAARDHFDRHVHAALGECHYERNGFRLSDAASGYTGPAPTLGQHTDEILADVLGYSPAEIAALHDAGGVE
jgi:crotonobetainyl-CoA:carnitine CoA-transferase CaiB-like acyl-CoA transferase